MSKIKMGWAEVDITPNQKISLSGQFYERVSDVVESRLYVTAFALESGNDQMNCFVRPCWRCTKLE